MTTSRGYNGFGELSDLSAAYSGSDLFDATYVRDALGRVDTLTQVIQTDTTVYVYSYDEIGRLEEVETDGVVQLHAAS
ncbi:MAG: hypothetical protein R3195_15015 [Gemmatimonadota bacterium]|nr:hypothetical protein [Gemmatimonadota bacterium]